MQQKTKKIALIATIPVVAIGWALFRPELIFVNQSVNEKTPVASATNKVLSSGKFDSFAHETTGNAEIWNADGKSIVRLSNFKTSNGPDVHILLIKGNDPKHVEAGSYLDLGVIKGNIGDQNYTIPAGTNLSEYGAVSIWCKRFAVNFGGSTISNKTAKLSFTKSPILTSQPVAFGSEIMVTGGKFKAEAPGVKGRADIVERDGKRYVRLTGASAGSVKDAEVYLVKKETVAPGTDITKLEKVKLGSITGGKTQEFGIAKDLDVWLFRSVTIWNTKTNKPLGSAALRSSQEKSAFFTNLEIS